MKLGITEQPEISPTVLKLIDFIEIKTLTPQNLKYFSQFKKPFLFHVINFHKKRFIWVVNEDFIDLISEQRVREIINSSSFDWFSFHLALAREKIKIKIENNKFNLTGLGKKFSQKEILENIYQSVQRLKKIYPKFKLVFESSPFELSGNVNGAFDYICEPDFINQIIKENECYFLLDIPHCFVSAKNLGYKNPKDYFLKLPLEKTLEIHISGAKKYQGENFWRDAHLHITAREIDLLKFVLSRAKNAKALVLEAQGLHSEKPLIKELKGLKGILLKYF